MTTSSDSPLPRLADALTEVSARLKDIGDEIRVLQTAPRPQQTPQPTPQPQQTPHPASPPWPYAAPPPFPPVYAAPRHAPAATPPAPMYAPRTLPPPVAPRPHPAGPSLWERVSREGAGSRLLAWVGGVVTLAGVVLLLVLAIQRGYIGPLPRVLVGALLGSLLVGTGLWLHRTEAGRVGGRAVAATGFAGLYLDVIAATSIYHFLNPAAGLTAGLAVAGAGVGVAARWKSQLFAMFVVLAAAVSAPILTGWHDPVLLVGFLLVLQLATTPVHLACRWGGLALAAGIPPTLAVLIETAAAYVGPVDARTVVALCIAVGALQVVVATLLAVRRDTGFAVGLMLSAPVPVLLSASLLGVHSGAVVVGGFAAVLAVIWTLHRTGLLPAPDGFALAAGGGAATSALEALCLGFDGAARAGSVLAAAALFALLAGVLRYAAAAIGALVFAALGTLFALAHPLRPDFLAVAPHGDVAGSRIAAAGTTGVLLAAAVLALAWAGGRVTIHDDPTAAHWRWAGAGLLALYGATGAVVSVGLAASPDVRGFLAGHVAVTVSWTIAALVLLLRYVDSTPLRVAGLALVGAAVVKLVLFDLGSLSGIPRVLSFLGAGLVLLAAGAKYAARAPQHREPVQAGGSTYRS